MLVHLIFGCAVWMLVLFLSLWGWGSLLSNVFGGIRSESLAMAAFFSLLTAGFFTTAYALFFTGAYLVMPYYEIIITAG